MADPFLRDDLSRFVVHLTRRYGSKSALGNLVNILATKKIEARTAHCLFMHEIDRLGFTDKLASAFRTVCFTETPLSQISKLADPEIDRSVQLEPYGLVFLKDFLVGRGGNPAVYINAYGDSSVKDMLLSDFRKSFRNSKSLANFKKRFPTTGDARIRYSSLINVVQSNHDFTWEREWRHNGDLKFKYADLVAVICPSEPRFRIAAKKRMTRRQHNFLERMPVINAKWGLEDIVEQLSVTLWENAEKTKVKRQ